MARVNVTFEPGEHRDYEAVIAKIVDSPLGLGYTHQQADALARTIGRAGRVASYVMPSWGLRRRERQARGWGRMLSKGAQALAGTDGAGLSVTDAVRLVVDGAKLRRMGLNLSTEIQQQRVTTLVGTVTGQDAAMAMDDPAVAAAAHELLRLVAAKKPVGTAQPALPAPVEEAAPTEP